MQTIDFKKISLFKTPEESPGYLLWRVSTQWRSAIETVLAPLNLTHPQFVVLASLSWLTRKGENVSQILIGRSSGLDPNTTSQILRGLEKKGLIVRKQKVDERSKNPLLTPEGAEILKQALPAVENADKTFFSALTQDEQKQAVSSFQKLLNLTSR